MRVLQVNATYKIGSTGKIMADLSDVITENGWESYMVCAYATECSNKNLFVTSRFPYQLVLKENILISRITGRMGYRYYFETKNLIKWIEKINPDIIHLHNIHGDWINVFLLFDYIKKSKKPVIWTLHDCWAFTGRCSHFELCKCKKWKTGCYKCHNKKVYPITYFFDFSSKMWLDKKRLFSIENPLTIITPSEWLKQYVDESFLNYARIKVINNGIDVRKYKPFKDAKARDLKESKKKIILGVASSWSETKGLFDMIKINELMDHSIYQMILVGLSEKQKKDLPNSIIGITRTNNQDELIELYSKADVFINPTYQDNYPTVNLEAISCGTPVITYKTGGCPEIIADGVGYVINQGDIENVIKAIEDICKYNKCSREDCRQYAIKHFDKRLKYQEYIKLYKEMERYI